MSQEKPVNAVGKPDDIQCYLVGGGMASLASAVYLIRDGQVPGHNIHILEESRLGGSLDASGSAEQGYSMRGSRMFGPAYVLTYALLDEIPTLEAPDKSISQDIFEFWQAQPWFDKARLVENGQLVDAADWGFRNRDRADLVKLMLQSEEKLGAKRIDACFDPLFFETNFWLMWCSMFGFETWHSASELRRYLLRFLRLFPDLETLQLIQSTRYCGYDSIVRPMVAWLENQGVQLETGVRVTDLKFAPAGGKQAARCIHAQRDDTPFDIEVRESDLVIVTLGSMTADSRLGSMHAAPVRPKAMNGAAWALWQTLAGKDPRFGRPATFCGQVDRTKWITFTVTQHDPLFFRLMARLSGSPAGRGGLVTLKGSPWLLTFHLYPTPAFASQPEGVDVWWGYGLFPDRLGSFVPKKMSDCSGEEILVEVFSHLGFRSDMPALLASANCIPCLLPYTTSQFMPRARGDRPDVVPEHAANFAFVGQYCEIPDNVVYTVEYSVQSAMLAVSGLLGIHIDAPPTYQGLDHPNALVGALKRILQ